VEINDQLTFYHKNRNFLMRPANFHLSPSNRSISTANKVLLQVSCIEHHCDPVINRPHIWRTKKQQNEPHLMRKLHYIVCKHVELIHLYTTVLKHWPA